jgi:hypothetical protein
MATAGVEIGPIVNLNVTHVSSSPPPVDDLTAFAAERSGEQTSASRPRGAIRVGSELTEVSDALIGRFVAEARANGLSWTEIGDVFGTSKQAVQQREGTRSDELGRWPERWTPAANDAFDRAAQHARDLGHSYVGTEHVLLALATAEHGIAATVLHELGVTSERILATTSPPNSEPASPIPNTCSPASLP